MRLLVGCPVAFREWILPRWFDHVRKAVDVAGVEAGFVFVCDDRDPSLPVIVEHAPDAVVVPCTTRRGMDKREWNPNRYREMVMFRNALLRAVRRDGPDAFLSLDSDILAHPDQVAVLVESLERFDAVGGRCYMTSTGRKFPSYAHLTRSRSLLRTDATGVFGVDVIMAIKLMGPAAYDVDYELHAQGEDVGWSVAARERGVRLGWDGRVISKHVMRPHLLDVVDARVGF